jgi:hypothetical protein
MPRRTRRALSNSRPLASLRSSVRNDHPSDLAASSRVRFSRWQRIKGARSLAGDRLSSSSSRPRSSRHTTSANGSERQAISPIGKRGRRPIALRQHRSATPCSQALSTAGLRIDRAQNQDEKGRLKRVVGIGACAKNAAADAKYGRSVPANNILEGRRFAVRMPLNQVGIGGSLGCQTNDLGELDRMPRHVGLRELDEHRAATNTEPANFLGAEAMDRFDLIAQMVCKSAWQRGFRPVTSTTRPTRRPTLAMRLAVCSGHQWQLAVDRATHCPTKPFVGKSIPLLERDRWPSSATASTNPNRFANC